MAYLPKNFNPRLRKQSGTLKVKSSITSFTLALLSLWLVYCWWLGVYATSRHIPGVRFAGTSHPGLIGTAPSKELLATWNEREPLKDSFRSRSLLPPTTKSDWAEVVKRRAKAGWGKCHIRPVGHYQYTGATVLSGRSRSSADLENLLSFDSVLWLFYQSQRDVTLARGQNSIKIIGRKLLTRALAPYQVESTEVSDVFLAKFVPSLLVYIVWSHVPLTSCSRIPFYFLLGRECGY